MNLIKAVEPEAYINQQHIVALEIQRESRESFMVLAFTTASDSYMKMVILKKSIKSLKEAERFILSICK